SAAAHLPEVRRGVQVGPLWPNPLAGQEHVSRGSARGPAPGAPAPAAPVPAAPVPVVAPVLAAAAPTPQARIPGPHTPRGGLARLPGRARRRRTTRDPPALPPSAAFPLPSG